jgi:MFS family permease
VVYGAGSLTTALAQSLPELIVGWSLLERMGAALILPTIVAHVATNFSAAERPKAYGLVAASGAIAVATGPLIGGLLTTYASSGTSFVSDAQLQSALAETDLDPAAAAAIVDENAQSRLAGPRSALAVLALLALVALFTSGGLPTRHPGSPQPDPAKVPGAEPRVSPPAAH